MQPVDAPVIILRQEGVTQVEPLLVVLYGITVVSLVEDLRDADPILLSPFYADDVAVQLRLLMEGRPDWGYFPEPAKSLFIADNP